MLRLRFSVSNNVAEYEALVNGLRIAIELGVRRLDARGDSQLVIDQVIIGMCPLVSLAKRLSMLFIFLKNQLLIGLIL